MALAAPAAGRWVWLFPATMALHALEEAATGETFPRWVSRSAGVDLAAGEFLALNAIALAVIVAGTVLALRLQRGAWAVAALGAAVLGNGLAHLAATLATASWSPGVVTGTLLWIPLGTFALTRAARRGRPADLAIGIALGLLAHGAIVLAILLA